MTEGDGAAPWGTPRFMSLNASFHKKQGYIWFRGGDLNGFWDMRPFMKWRGGANPQGTPGLCHWMRLIIRNNNIYGLGVGIWMVSDIWPFLNWKRVGKSPGNSVYVNGCILSRNNNVYMGYGWDSNWFLRYWAIYEVKGVGHAVAAILDFNWLSFSYFMFLRCPDAPQQGSTQMDFSL